MGLEPGATNTLTIMVDESMTADRFGNTGVQVLATPMLVSYFELAAHQLALPALEPGQGTVGSHIDVRHLAATPIGMPWRESTQRPGRLRVGDDWAEGTVEVQAEGDLVRPRRQPDGPLGQDSPGAGHGRRSRGNSCSAPGASSTVWSRTRTLMGGAGPGRDLTSRWSSASSTSTRWPR